MKNTKKAKKSVNNGKRYDSCCFNKLGKNNNFMHETIKIYVTIRFALSEKLALKTPNVLIKMALFVDFALFFRTIDGLLRYGTIGYGKIGYGTIGYGTIGYGTIGYGTGWCAKKFG